MPRPSNGVIRFPPTPERDEAPDLFLRGFGEAPGDLEIDFQQDSRLDLEIDVLERCTIDSEGRAAGAAFLGSLSIGKRTECLLRIAGMGGPEEIELHRKCPACAEAMEVTLDIAELAELQRQAESRGPIVIPLGGAGVTARRPTGDDQRAWLSQSYPNRDAAALAMFETLLPAAPPEKAAGFFQDGLEWLGPAEAALADGDPLVDFEMRVNCPHCESQSRQGVDLSGWALERLAARQAALVRTLHRLAARYGWTEAQIFAVPPWRRARYLALIDEEDGL